MCVRAHFRTQSEEGSLPQPSSIPCLQRRCPSRLVTPVFCVALSLSPFVYFSGCTSVCGNALCVCECDCVCFWLRLLMCICLCICPHEWRVCVHASALIGGCAIIRVCVSSSVCTCIFQNVSVCICLCPRVCAYHPEYVCVPLSVNVCVFPWTYLCVFLDECLPMFVGVVCVSVSLLSLSLSFFLFPADFILHGLVSYQSWIFPVNNVEVVAGEL